ncbi:MAG: DUF2281 domain-containing protein [Saprospiraceae bacterium]|nr:DUF2281 domain-containing protein [Saprospiraceae bacterium]
MSELLLKFNQLNDLQRQEVLDFINFLLTKSKQKQQKSKEYQEETEDAYNFFESAGLMENRDIDADQLRRDA